VSDLERICRLLWEAACDDDPGLRPLAARMGVGPRDDHPTTRARTVLPHEIAWLDGKPPPPPNPPTQTPWAAKAAQQLQRRPGAWAVVRVAATKAQAQHCVTALKRLGAEATQRREGRGHVVYGSWPEMEGT